MSKSRRKIKHIVYGSKDYLKYLYKLLTILLANIVGIFLLIRFMQ